MPNGRDKINNFVARVYDPYHYNDDNTQGAWVPIYVPPDGTDHTKGMVFLEDGYTDAIANKYTASEGMTAATPKAVNLSLKEAKKYTDDEIADLHIDNIDASQITSGVIDIARIPQAAFERLKKVANQAGRFGLTKNDVQNGDSVLQVDTGVMYIVVDDTKLNSEAGYQVYQAGTAASVPWSGVTDKPNATTSTPGLMSAADKQILDKLNGSFVSGVKGNAETTYRVGNVNLTPANIGAVAKSGDTMSGNLKMWASNFVLSANGTAATGNRVSFTDNAGVEYAYVGSGSNANGSPYVNVVAQKTLNGTTVSNGVTLGVTNTNGTLSPTVSVTSSAAWRTAIDAAKTDHTHANATSTTPGFMSAADKVKLDSISGTVSVATSTTLGGIKTGYLANGKNYPVSVDSSGNAYVNVPWTDNNTWTANSASAAGYVASGSGQANKVWKTDASGNPAWRDDANSITGVKGNSETTYRTGNVNITLPNIKGFDIVVGTAAAAATDTAKKNTIYIRYA